RGPLRARRPVHAPAAPAARRHVSDRGGAVPLRRLPPRLPLLGVPGAGWRAGRPAADVLVLDRHQPGRQLRPHLHLEPPVRAADLPAGRELGAHAAGPDPSLPAAGPGLPRGRRELVGVDADRRGRLARPLAAAGGPDRLPAGAELPAAGAALAWRSGGVGPGAPVERGLPRPDRRRVRDRHAQRGAGLPGTEGAAAERRPRRGHLGRAVALLAGGGALADLAPGGGGPSDRRCAGGAAARLGVVARAGSRDPAQAPLITPP